MENITLLISCYDWEYGTALSKGISNLHSEFNVILEKKKIEGDDNLQDKVDEIILQSKDKGIRVLLSEEPLWEMDSCFETLNESEEFEKQWEDKQRQHKQKEMHQQMEQKQGDRYKQIQQKHDEHVEAFYKYSSVSEIAKYLKLLYCKTMGRAIPGISDGSCKIVGFYGLSGGSGKTVLTIGTGREITRFREKKVLYINWEEFDSNDIYFDVGHELGDELLQKGVKQSTKNLNYYLYHLLSKNRQLIDQPIDCFTQEDAYGLEFFPSSSGRNPLKSLNIEEIQKFIKNICQSGRYEYIFIDFNRDLSEENATLLNLCHQIVLVREDTLESRVKANKVFQYLQTDGIHITNQNWIWVNNKGRLDNHEIDTNREELVRGFISHPIEGGITVFFDPNALHIMENKINISIENTFGMGVKEIAAKLTEL